MKKIFPILLIPVCLSSCSLSSLGTKDGEERVTAPKAGKFERREQRGSLSGDNGLFSIGGTPKADEEGGKSSLAVNSFLWRATLDTLSFMPMASADPFGGVILTDWHEPSETPGERFKVNALILSKTLRADGIKLSVFKQKLEGETWRDQPVDNVIARKLEDAILTRARELKIQSTK